jgi:hypothetical protein
MRDVCDGFAEDRVSIVPVRHDARTREVQGKEISEPEFPIFVCPSSVPASAKAMYCDNTVRKQIES